MSNRQNGSQFLFNNINNNNNNNNNNNKIIIQITKSELLNLGNIHGEIIELSIAYSI